MNNCKQIQNIFNNKMPYNSNPCDLRVLTFQSSSWKQPKVGVTQVLSHLWRFYFHESILIYLVYGRDKSFDMQSLKAFKSIKAYKFFYDGFVKNAWVYECPVTQVDNDLKLLYFCAYVHHSLTCESPLQVFVSINGNSGEVYSAKCNCVSG